MLRAIKICKLCGKAFWRHTKGACPGPTPLVEVAPGEWR